MSLRCRSYSREDILHYKTKSSDINGCQILDHQLFKYLSKDVNKQLSSYRTKRGKRAGKRTKEWRSLGTIHQNNRKPSNLVPIPKHKQSRPTFLPSILYTNCRSLNTWKFAELESYVEIHKPNIICLTETWLDANKQQDRKSVV